MIAFQLHCSKKLIHKYLSSLPFFFILAASLFAFFLETDTLHAEDSKKNSLQRGKNYLCLTMIVRNESKTIERCLNSVKDIVDCIVICDTGSTDNTIEIIEKYLQRNQIPGKIYQHEWKNFSHNRTLAAQVAKRMLFDNGYPLPDTYLLFLDADMVLEKKPGFNKQDLNEPSYLILQTNHDVSSYSTRLVRANLPWISIGYTYDFWYCQFLGSGKELSHLVIFDLEDGGSQKDKFDRDLKLLQEGIIKEPDNSRYMFYLAVTHKHLHSYEEAIKWFKIRLEQDDENEEIWYSNFLLGESYEALGSWEQAFQTYLETYISNPHRIEPLQKILLHYNLPSRCNSRNAKLNAKSCFMKSN